MPGGKSPGPSIKNPDTYEALKRQGKSKRDAARISNAQAKGKKGKKSTKKTQNKRRNGGSSR
jgi:hypothetical protein